MDLVDLLTEDLDDYGCGAYIKPIHETCGVDGYFCEACQLRFQSADEIERLRKVMEEALGELGRRKQLRAVKLLREVLNAQ